MEGLMFQNAHKYLHVPTALEKTHSSLVILFIQERRTVYHEMYIARITNVSVLYSFNFLNTF